MRVNGWKNYNTYQAWMILSNTEEYYNFMSNIVNDRIITDKDGLIVQEVMRIQEDFSDMHNDFSKDDIDWMDIVQSFLDNVYS